MEAFVRVNTDAKERTSEYPVSAIILALAILLLLNPCVLEVLACKDLEFVPCFQASDAKWKSDYRKETMGCLTCSLILLVGASIACSMLTLDKGPGK